MSVVREIIRDHIKKYMVEEYLEKKLERAGCGGVELVRTPLGSRIIIHAEKTGLVIGRRGRKLKMLAEELREKFGLDNPDIEVRPIDVPELNPQIMARWIARAIERGVKFRRAAYSALRRIMDAGAKGCEIIISGKLTGERARTEKFKAGKVLYSGEDRWLMREGFAEAKPKPGVIGVKVRILPPDAKPSDEVEIGELPEEIPEELESERVESSEHGGEK